MQKPRRSGTKDANAINMKWKCTNANEQQRLAFCRENAKHTPLILLVFLDLQE
jgi:hypothetical protein